MYVFLLVNQNRLYIRPVKIKFSWFSALPPTCIQIIEACCGALWCNLPALWSVLLAFLSPINNLTYSSSYQPVWILRQPALCYNTINLPLLRSMNTPTRRCSQTVAMVVFDGCKTKVKYYLYELYPYPNCFVFFL